VRQSDENVELFDPQRITDALVRETNLASETAHKIALEVKEQIGLSGIRALTAPLIRGLVDAKLLERGLMNEYRLHSRLGVPLYDVDRVIQSVSARRPRRTAPKAAAWRWPKPSSASTPAATSSLRPCRTPTWWEICTSKAWARSTVRPR